MSDLNTFAGSLVMSSAVKDFTGDVITVAYNGHTSDEITAECCSDEQAIDEATGMLLLSKRVTFKIDAADLVINSQTLEPTPGMRITLGTKVFEVQPPPGNQQCFQPLLGGLRWLIYAVQVGVT